MGNIEKLIDINDVCELLGLSRSAVYKMVHTKRIPYVKIGRLVKFKPSKIRSLIEKNSVEIKDKITLYHG